MSQSAVSQAVALLERTLGVPLLLRGRDGATLTTAGATALAEVRAALAAVERLAACMASPKTLSGPLRVGVVQSAAVRLLPGWLRRLRAGHPGIRVALYEGKDTEIMDWVLAGIVEVGITRACPQLSQIVVAARWMAARKLRAVLSYRVAMARNCLSLAKKFSMRWRVL